MTPPGHVLTEYSTWAITIGVSSFVNWALGIGLHRTADELLVDLLLSGFSTATGLAAAGMWWHRRSNKGKD